MKHSLFNIKITTSFSILFALILLQTFSLQAQAASEKMSGVDSPVFLTSDLSEQALIAQADDDEFDEDDEMGEIDEDDVEHFDEDELPEGVEIDDIEEMGPPPTKD